MAHVGDKVDAAGRSFQLAKKVGTGAAATVWTIESTWPAWRSRHTLPADILVKIYDKPALQPKFRPDASSIESHATAIMLRLANANIAFPAMDIASPIHRVTGPNGDFVGLALPAFREGWDPLESLWQGPEKLETLRDYALALARTTERIHEKDFVIGDFCPKNILCHRSKPRVAIVDVDSWGHIPGSDSISASGFGFRDMGLTPFQPSRWEYSPGGNSLDNPTRQSDQYALGLMLVEILTGMHPYGVDRVGYPTMDIRTNMQASRTWLVDSHLYLFDRTRFSQGRHPGVSALAPCLQDLVEPLLDERVSNYAEAGKWVVALETAIVDECIKCGNEKWRDATCVGCANLSILGASTATNQPATGHPERSRSRVGIAVAAVVVAIMVVLLVLNIKYR